MSWACAVELDENYFLREKVIESARKEHICVFCKNPISVGSLYGKVFWVFDGQCGEEKFHFDCKDLMHEAAELLCNDSTIALDSDLEGAANELMAASSRDWLGITDFEAKEWMMAYGEILEKYGYGD